jgi:hypothetical protein
VNRSEGTGSERKPRPFCDNSNQKPCFWQMPEMPCLRLPVVSFRLGCVQKSGNPHQILVKITEQNQTTLIIPIVNVDRSEGTSSGSSDMKDEPRPVCDMYIILTRSPAGSGKNLGICLCPVEMLLVAGILPLRSCSHEILPGKMTPAKNWTRTDSL